MVIVSIIATFFHNTNNITILKSVIGTIHLANISDFKLVLSRKF